jgi:hypothetical protein
MPLATFTVNVQPVEDYMERVKRSVFAAVRAGMQEGMEGLAWTVAGKLGGDPITSRSGALLGAILGSAKVRETAAAITGTVSSDVGGKHLGLWLEEGTHVPATKGNGAKLYGFFPADGSSVFTHGHAAFQVAPHPFLNPSLAEYSPTILDLIRTRVAEAVDGTV